MIFIGLSGIHNWAITNHTCSAVWIQTKKGDRSSGELKKVTTSQCELETLMILTHESRNCTIAKLFRMQCWRAEHVLGLSLLSRCTKPLVLYYANTSSLVIVTVIVRIFSTFWNMQRYAA
jgi:hypothetical protein